MPDASSVLTLSIGSPMRSATLFAQGSVDSRGVGGVPLWIEYLVVPSPLVSARMTATAAFLFFAQRPMIQKSSKMMVLFVFCHGTGAMPTLNSVMSEVVQYCQPPSMTMPILPVLNGLANWFRP